MSTLQLYYPQPGHCVDLIRVDTQDSESNEVVTSGFYEFHLAGSALLHEGHSKVYKGKLGRSPGNNDNYVVCKLVEGNTARLEHEAQLYTTNLSSLQGSCVPKFFGLFKRETAGESIACIILEYCGTTLSGKKEDYPDEVK